MSALASDTASGGGDTSSDRMEECCVSPAAFLDGELELRDARCFDASVPSVLGGAAAAMDAKADPKKGSNAGETALAENDWEPAARERVMSSRLAGSTGGVSRSRLAPQHVGREAVLGGRLVPVVAAAGAGEGPESMKRKGADRDQDGGDAASRDVRHKGDAERAGTPADDDAVVVCIDDPPQREPSEGLSDATAKPSTPEPADPADPAGLAHPIEPSEPIEPAKAAGAAADADAADPVGAVAAEVPTLNPEP